MFTNPKPVVLLKQLSALCVIVVSLQSCFTPKRVDKWVATQYEGALTKQPKKANDYLAITSKMEQGDGKISVTTGKTSHFLPLLFYWQWDYTKTCVLNPKIPIDNFTNTVITYAARKGLKQKLNGNRIELSIDKLPNAFAIDYYGHVIWVIYAIKWDKLTIQAEKQPMVISYKVMQGDKDVKTGIITVADPNTDEVQHMFQSTKKRTWAYLERYDDNIATMSKQVVDKLMTEL